MLFPLIKGEDYEQISVQLPLAGNQSTAVINIPIKNDSLAEGLETIRGMLQVVSPSNYSSSVSNISIEIIDNEGSIMYIIIVYKLNHIITRQRSLWQSCTIKGELQCGCSMQCK